LSADQADALIRVILRLAAGVARVIVMINHFVQMSSCRLRSRNGFVFQTPSAILE
jgi:hypothetical protein